MGALIIKKLRQGHDRGRGQAEAGENPHFRCRPSWNSDRGVRITAPKSTVPGLHTLYCLWRGIATWHKCVLISNSGAWERAPFKATCTGRQNRENWSATASISCWLCNSYTAESVTSWSNRRFTRQPPYRSMFTDDMTYSQYEHHILSWRIPPKVCLQYSYPFPSQVGQRGLGDTRPESCGAGL
jgi:hypothetical protein